MPAFTGNGLAMRAGMVLDALTARHRVSLLVAPLYPGLDAVPRELGKRCAAVRVLELRPDRQPGLLSLLLRPSAGYRGKRFEVVHVFRLAALSFARPYLDCAAPPKLHLDLDDIESLAARRLAALRRQNGDDAGASASEQQARRAEVEEQAAMAQADRLYVCSELDRSRLKARGAGEVLILPNAVRVPARPGESGGDGPFRFLFIGTLGYYPNDDAAQYLCREIAPLIRTRSATPFALEIAGPGATPKLRQAAAEANAILRGAIPAVDEAYGRAGAVLVPVRAGGGTRIKILEAFSYRRPVVSTPVGAEGIDARNEQEILIADTPEGFAEASARLIADSALRSRLAASAYDLVRRCYSPEAIAHVLAV